VVNARAIRGPLLAFLGFGVLWGTWAAVLPGIRAETGASEAGLGAALLCVAVGALPAMLAAGVAIDRLGPLVAPSLLAFAAAFVLPGLAGSVPALAAALVAVGVASGTLDVAANAAVATLEAETGRRLMQAAHALFSAGVVVGSATAGLARDAGASPRSILLVTAAAVALTALPNRGGRRRAVAERRPARLVLTPLLLVLGVLCAVAFVVESGIESWSALYLEDELDASPAASGLGPASFAAAMALGRLLGQGLGTRAGDRALVAGGALLAGSGVLVAAAAGAAPVALAGFAIGGAGISMAAPVFFGVPAYLASAADRGGAVSTVTTISYLGFLTGPALMGAVAATLGLRAIWLVLAAVATTLALAVFALALPLRGRAK
jgi:MFS family permease